MCPDRRRESFLEMFSKPPLPRRGAEPRQQDVASGAAQLATCSPCRSPKIRFNVNWKLPIGGALERGLSSALWISCLAVLSYSFISCHAHTLRHRTAPIVRRLQDVPLPYAHIEHLPNDDLRKPSCVHPEPSIRHEPALLPAECLHSRHARHSLHHVVLDLVQDSHRFAR